MNYREEVHRLVDLVPEGNILAYIYTIVRDILKEIGVDLSAR